MSTVPLWQRPALIVARWHRGLESFVEVDRIMLARLRVPEVAIVAYILVVTVVPSFFHAIAEFGDVNVLTLTRIALRSVFTESMPFMAAGLLLGMLAPTAGASFVAAFIPLDLVAAAIQQQELTPLLPAIAGRAVSYWLLWLLVVEIPILVRTGFLSVDRSGQVQRAMAFMLSVGAGFVMTWVWAQAVTMLIRPVFTWSDLYAPYYAAVGPVQEGGTFLALLGALGAAAVTVLYLRIQPGQGVSLLFAPPDRRRRPLGLIPITIVLTLALLGGLITTVLDLVLLAVAVVAARPIASFLRGRIKVWERIASIPWVIRFAIAFGLAYLGAGVIVVPLYQTTGGSEFLPLVLAEIVILVLYEFLCGENESEPAAGKSPAATGAAATFLFFGAPLVLLLLIPLTARADNCSSRSDCWPTPWPAAAAAAGVGGAVMMNKNRQRPPDKPSIKKARDATDLLSKAPGLKHLSIQKKLVGALLGSQFDAANEISRQLGDDPPRDDFQEMAVVVARPRPPIPHADLLGPEMTAALERSYEAHQMLLAHGEAAVISFDRYGGARRAGARQWVEKQAMAVIEHKKAMAPSLRAAADAIQEAWRMAESFKPTGNLPDSILDHLTAADFDYARGLGLDEPAIRARGEAMASDRGIPDDDDIDRIQSSYRGLAGSFERLPFPAVSPAAV